MLSFRKTWNTHHSSSPTIIPLENELNDLIRFQANYCWCSRCFNVLVCCFISDVAANRKIYTEIEMENLTKFSFLLILFFRFEVSVVVVDDAVIGHTLITSICKFAIETNAITTTIIWFEQHFNRKRRTICTSVSHCLSFISFPVFKFYFSIWFLYYFSVLVCVKPNRYLSMSPGFNLTFQFELEKEAIKNCNTVYSSSQKGKF